MAVINFDEVPFFVNGDVVDYPLRGTPCVMTKDGVVKNVFDPAYYDENSEARLRLDKVIDDAVLAARSRIGKFKSLKASCDADRDWHEVLFEVYDPPILNLYPGSLRATFEDLGGEDPPLAARKFKGKWQRAIHNCVRYIAKANALVFCKYVFDTRIDRKSLVDMVLSEPVFLDPLECSENAKVINFEDVETWQARRNVNRAIDTLLDEGILFNEGDGVVSFNVITGDDPKAIEIAREITDVRRQLCFFRPVVDLSAWA